MNDKGIILLSCWAKPLRTGAWNAKNPSKEWWKKLAKLLKDEGYTVLQAGQGPEIKLQFVDRYLWDKDLWALGEDIKTCSTFVCVDNFFHHFAWLRFKKKGVVIFSCSDPEIFGHPENINLLKDKKYLRPRQYEMWESCQYNADAFVDQEEVVKSVNNIVGEINQKSE